MPHFIKIQRLKKMNCHSIVAHKRFYFTETEIIRFSYNKTLLRLMYIFSYIKNDTEDLLTFTEYEIWPPAGIDFSVRLKIMQPFVRIH